MNTTNSPKPRLAYVLWDFPALSQTFVMNELRWLLAKGYDVKVYYAADAEKPATLDFAVESFVVKDGKALATLLKKHQRTLMHSFFAYPAATRLAWPAAIESGIPFTFGAHAVDIFHYKNDQRNELLAMTRDSHCLRVFVPGAFHHTYLVERGVPWEKLVVCPQAVDLVGLTARTEPDIRGKRVITVARFVEKKGLANLILAGKALQDQDISIEIHGYGPLEESYRSLIQSEGLRNVSIHPPIQSREDYVSVLHSGDLFIAPSVRASNGDMDGIPTVLMEAMSLGVPVAASRVSSIPDLVIDGLTGLLMTPGDPQDIANTIQAFFAMSEQEQGAMTERASTHAASLSSVDRTMESLCSAWASPPVHLY